ncbi:unnamed protein product [Adineta steineri]|uniref:Fibrinogen C-terminal domain-containing protein n=1 Tax=Adineta steineri TaxID=433720 RepID=A0A819ARW7_9BILA|nr:unnamed protein product [Adineta steineri]
MLSPTKTASSTSTTTTRINHTTVPLLNVQNLTRMPSNITIERLEQFTDKQEKMLHTLRSNDNLTLHLELQRHLLNYNQSHSESNLDCLHQLPLHPKRNRTTRCLQLRVGLTETFDNVFCHNTDYPQWLTIQNRETNSIDFNRTWIEYRRGFGNIRNRTDFWIGNENLHWLTSTYSCRLKIEVTDWYNETRTATYEVFRIANQQDGYRIKISEYHGDMEVSNKIDSFSRWHHNARFSTYDHYATNTNCPQKHGGGGWWYHSGIECGHVQLNGRFATHSDGLVPFNTGILWIGWKSDRHYSFQRVNMAIQPKSKQTRLSNRY